MATYRDPVRCFAPLEVIERLLEIRVEAGYFPSVYLLSPDDLADYLRPRALFADGTLESQMNAELATREM